jgi:ribosome-associated heat shock protein Hsp15
MRLDQWLWAIRLYRSRTLAVDGIRGGHVRVNGETAKPARELRPGDRIDVKVGPLLRQLEFIAAPPRRVGAPKVPDFAQDHTTPEAILQAREAGRNQPGFRMPGTGRPTKRDRRKLDNLPL